MAEKRGMPEGMTEGETSGKGAYDSPKSPN